LEKEEKALQVERVLVGKQWQVPEVLLLLLQLVEEKETFTAKGIPMAIHHLRPLLLLIA